MFRQLLAQQVTNIYFIGLADSVESVSNPGFNINFSENIIIEAKKKAIEEVKKYYLGNIFLVRQIKAQPRKYRSYYILEGQNS